MKPRNIRPLLAIYPAIIGKKRYALTWEQLRTLERDGCDVAVHGYYHRKMDRRFFEREPKSAVKEIFFAKKLLEERLGRTVDVFVYPYGVRTPEAVRLIRQAGYRMAFTIESGGMRIPAMTRSRRYELPRYMVTKGNWKWCVAKMGRNYIRAGKSTFVAHAETAEREHREREARRVEQERSRTRKEEKKKPAPRVAATSPEKEPDGMGRDPAPEDAHDRGEDGDVSVATGRESHERRNGFRDIPERFFAVEKDEAGDFFAFRFWRTPDRDLPERREPPGGTTGSTGTALSTGADRGEEYGRTLASFRLPGRDDRERNAADTPVLRGDVGRGGGERPWLLKREICGIGESSYRSYERAIEYIRVRILRRFASLRAFFRDAWKRLSR